MRRATSWRAPRSVLTSAPTSSPVTWAGEGRWHAYARGRSELCQAVLGYVLKTPHAIEGDAMQAAALPGGFVET